MNLLKRHVFAAIACAGVLSPAETHAKAFVALHDFACTTDGRLPYAGLSYHDGLLYGTTPVGGADPANGTIYEVNPVTGGERIIHNFTGTPDGSEPFAGLLFHNGTFYGTTNSGGTAGAGTVFAVKPATGAETVLYSFTGGADAAYPQAGLIYARGRLFGTAGEGGAAGQGAVFAVDPRSGAETVTYSFTGGQDGGTPVGSLVQQGNFLYGTTTFGGSAGAGTVFRLNPNTGAEKVIYSFQNVPDAGFPSGGLTFLNGLIYGTTSSGGTAKDGGTVFAINPQTGAETVLHRFGRGRDGAQPMAGLTYTNNLFYGTTSSGGKNGAGTVFSIDPVYGNEKTIYSFNPAGQSGAMPLSNLIFQSGMLFGTANQGAQGCGSVFSVVP